MCECKEKNWKKKSFEIGVHSSCFFFFLYAIYIFLKNGSLQDSAEHLKDLIPDTDYPLVNKWLILGTHSEDYEGHRELIWKSLCMFTCQLDSVLAGAGNPGYLLCVALGNFNPIINLSFPMPLGKKFRYFSPFLSSSFFLWVFWWLSNSQLRSSVHWHLKFKLVEWKMARSWHKCLTCMHFMYMQTLLLTSYINDFTKKIQFLYINIKVFNAIL